MHVILKTRNGEKNLIKFKNKAKGQCSSNGRNYWSFSKSGTDLFLFIHPKHV